MNLADALRSMRHAVTSFWSPLIRGSEKQDEAEQRDDGDCAWCGPLFRRNEEADPHHDSDGVWCVVANIKREHPCGPEGSEIKSGTRQFRGGTKVYIAGCFPGTCDSVVCIGLHRKSRRFITCIVNVKHVENFRVKLVYHPRVLELIEDNGDCFIRTKEDAEKWAQAFPRWQEMWA